MKHQQDTKQLLNERIGKGQEEGNSCFPRPLPHPAACPGESAWMDFHGRAILFLGTQTSISGGVILSQKHVSSQDPCTSTFHWYTAYLELGRKQCTSHWGSHPPFYNCPEMGCIPDALPVLSEAVIRKRVQFSGAITQQTHSAPAPDTHCTGQCTWAMGAPALLR